MFKDKPLGIPEHCQHDLSGRVLRLEFFGCRRWRLLPLYALPFGFWFIWWNQVSSPMMMRFQKLSPSRLYRSKRREQMSRRLCLCCPVRCLGTHLAETLWNPRLLCTTEEVGTWLMPTCDAISYIVILLWARIMALASSYFSPVVDVDCRPERSASITPVRSLNISIHSYTLRRGKALFPHRAHKRVWISVPLIPSAHKNRTTLLYSSLVQIERCAGMLTTQ
jgi:hypothetical protein